MGWAPANNPLIQQSNQTQLNQSTLFQSILPFLFVSLRKGNWWRDWAPWGCSSSLWASCRGARSAHNPPKVNSSAPFHSHAPSAFNFNSSLISLAILKDQWNEKNEIDWLGAHHFFIHKLIFSLINSKKDEFISFQKWWIYCYNIFFIIPFKEENTNQWNELANWSGLGVFFGLPLPP